jgi:DNA-binding CsgD family transcriptional regulator
MPASSSDPSPAPTTRAEPLTDRELQVLSVLAEGDTSPAIAARLGITVATVKSHLYNAYRKIGVTNRVGATRYYLEELADAARPSPGDSGTPPVEGSRPPAPQDLTSRDLEERITQLESVSAAADRLRRELEALRPVPRR